MAVVDSYSESNYDAGIATSSGSSGTGQSFTGDGGTLSSVKLYIKKDASTNGNGYVKIYAHTGTYGTDGTGTGSAIATSDAYDMSTISESFSLITFTFSGAEKMTLVNTTKYVLEFERPSGSGNITVGYDGSSPSHAGNYTNWFSTFWFSDSAKDLCFYVNKDDPTTTSTSSSTTSTSSSSSTTSTSSSTTSSTSTSISTTSTSSSTTSTSSSTSSSTTSTVTSSSTTSTSSSTTSTSSSTSSTTTTSTTTSTSSSTSSSTTTSSTVPYLKYSVSSQESRSIDIQEQVLNLDVILVK